jgi:hypothetical protein
MKEIFLRQSSAFLRHVSPASLLGGYVGKIARNLWWMNHEFSSVNVIIPPWLSIIIRHVVDNNMSIGGSSSET